MRYFALLKNLRPFLFKLWGDFSVRVFVCLLLAMSFLIILFDFIAIHSQQKLITSFMVQEGENLTALLADTVRLGVFSENRELLAAPVQAILKQQGVLAVQVINKDGAILYEDHPTNSPANDTRCEVISGSSRQQFIQRFRASHSEVIEENADCLIFAAPVMLASDQSDEQLYFTGGPRETPIKVAAGFVTVAVNKHSLEKSRQRAVSESFAIVVLFLALASLATYLIVKSATRPLSKLVEKIKDSDLQTGSHDDIDLISESFSALIDQLTESIAANKQLKNDLKDLARELIKTQEKERLNLALELHDNVAQELSSLKISCSRLLDQWPETPEEIVAKRDHLSTAIQKCIRIIRQLSHDLQPSELSQLGLVTTISHLCDNFAATHEFEIDFLASGFEGFEPDYNVAINCYRIIQEALHNVQKHAGASHIEIRLIASFPKIILRIKDNGIGFDVETRKPQAAAEQRMGLKNMEKRATLLNGLMILESHIGKGTRILVELPYTRMDDHGASREENTHR